MSQRNQHAILLFSNNQSGNRSSGHKSITRFVSIRCDGFNDPKKNPEAIPFPCAELDRVDNFSSVLLMLNCFEFTPKPISPVNWVAWLGSKWSKTDWISAKRNYLTVNRYYWLKKIQFDRSYELPLYFKWLAEPIKLNWFRIVVSFQNNETKIKIYYVV